MVRAFIGVRIDPQTVENISHALTHLEPKIAPLRWVPPENIHFTLKFLGAIDEQRIEPVGDALEQAVRPFSRFTINAKGLGVFPDLRRPRVLWVGLEGEDLEKLAMEIDAVLEPLGFPREKRAFKPHLTVGRWRQFAGSPTALGQELERRRDYEFGPSGVEQIVFFRSILKPQGAVYEPLKVVALPGAEQRV